MSARTPVVFDGGILAAGPLTGVARAFLYALAAHVRAVDVAPVLLLPPAAAATDIAGIIELRTRAVAGPLAREVWLPRLLGRLRARVFHVPLAAIPLRVPCPTVATVHDLPWSTPDLAPEDGHGWRHRRALRRALARATVVIVPSQATRDAIMKEPGPRRARIECVPHGVPFPATARDDSAATGPFVVLGDDRPRKNLARVRAAHASAARRRPGLPTLDEIGPRRGGGPASYVGETEKHRRLRHARALVHLSLHEGFGLPVLEAMGHGTPVVCSDRASLPEVAGDAALYVDPTDVEAIAAALCTIDTDDELRMRLAHAGRLRAAELVPERTAAAWRRIHDEIAR